MTSLIFVEYELAASIDRTKLIVSTTLHPFSSYCQKIFERELARLAAVQVESLGNPEEGTFTKVLIVLLGKLATVQVESLGKPEEEE